MGVLELRRAPTLRIAAGHPDTAPPPLVANLGSGTVPVGVVSSASGPRAYTGTPRRSTAVAAAGTGSRPCSEATVPLPKLSGEQ